MFVCQNRRWPSAAAPDSAAVPAGPVDPVAGCDTVHPVTFQRTLSGRTVKPPDSLDIPAVHTTPANSLADPGLRSDDTLVNSDNDDSFFPSSNAGDASKGMLVPFRVLSPG